jgi:hypothetical protein
MRILHLGVLATLRYFFLDSEDIRKTYPKLVLDFSMAIGLG